MYQNVRTLENVSSISISLQHLLLFITIASYYPWSDGTGKYQSIQFMETLLYGHGVLLRAETKRDRDDHRSSREAS